MDGTHRKVLSTRPFRLTLFVVALLLIVASGSRLGSSAQESDATPEASPEASPIAGSATENGSITIRMLGCDAGTTADSVGSTACSAVTGDIDIAIAGEGDVVTVDDALRVSAGVFRWTRLPFGTYSVDFASLPDGFTTALAASDAATAPEEIGEDGSEVTLDSAESSPTVTVYLIP